MRFEVNGETVFAGNGNGARAAGQPAVVFIHGAGFDHSVWVMPSRYFARHGCEVLALDLPGHGRSTGAALTSITALADWVADALTAAGIEQAVIVGHSMGSLIAFTLAARHPDRCAAIALLGTSAPMPVTSLLLDAAQDNHHAAIDMANTWSHSRRGKLGANDNPGQWMLSHGERLLERAADGVFFADLSACNGFSADGLKVNSPALVIVGERDQMTPAKAGLAVAEKLAGAKIVRLPGCGHSMLSEQPNQVLDALADFILG